MALNNNPKVPFAVVDLKIFKSAYLHKKNSIEKLIG